MELRLIIHILVIAIELTTQIDPCQLICRPQGCRPGSVVPLVEPIHLVDIARDIDGTGKPHRPPRPNTGVIDRISQHRMGDIDPSLPQLRSQCPKPPPATPTVGVDTDVQPLAILYAGEEICPGTPG